MSEATPRGQRAKRMALVAAGGSVILTMALAPVAEADQVTRQNASTTNNGSATANSGNNSATGNASTNSATSNQTATGGGAPGGIASNSSNTKNSSKGTAKITTGTATAKGNDASNTTSQKATGGEDAGGGVNVAEQNSFVTNTALAVANSGGNTAAGNLSFNTTSATQNATGDIATNQDRSSNTSDGTAEITTGAAAASGNTASNELVQAVAGGVGDGLTNVVQTANVFNSGDAFATSGGNVGTGNASFNSTTSDQTATGGAIGSNSSTGANTSNGTAEITTGRANASGNVSTTKTGQSVLSPDSSFLAVMLQDIVASNNGIADAANGANFADGNLSNNGAVSIQAATGDLASNTANSGNDSDGLGFVATGIANALGNEATDQTTQTVD